MKYSGNPVYIVMSSIEGGGGGGEDIHVIIKMLLLFSFLFLQRALQTYTCLLRINSHRSKYEFFIKLQG